MKAARLLDYNKPLVLEDIRAPDTRPDEVLVKIAIEGKSSADVGEELKKATGQDVFDAIIDCAGATGMMQLAFSRLATGGHYVDVGFVGYRIDVPLFPRVHGEQTFHGSFWGNNADLGEVLALAAAGKIQHTIKTIAFDDINEHQPDRDWPTADRLLSGKCDENTPFAAFSRRSRIFK